jgi:hypothetical protein
VQTLRNEINENINKVQIQLTQFVNTAIVKVQAEADRRADAMLQKLAQILETALRNDKRRLLGRARCDHNHNRISFDEYRRVRNDYYRYIRQAKRLA